MNLLHLSFVGGLRPHMPPPPPPTAEQRLSAFRAAYPAASANSYPWKWLDAVSNQEDIHDTVSSVQAMRISRRMLERIADNTLSRSLQTT